jgi:hypothetical protein
MIDCNRRFSSDTTAGFNNRQVAACRLLPPHYAATEYGL